MGLDLFPLTKPKSRNTQIRFVNARRQHKCGQAHTTKPNMNFSISLLLHFLLLVSLVCHVYSSETSGQNQAFLPEEEFHKLKRTIRIHLQKINKPYVKTIQSPDGDIIDCIVSHKQPAFDHPRLKGQKPLDPPERPKSHGRMNILNDNFQLWILSGESCSEGTVPIRRIKEEDMLRAYSINTFGRKLKRVRRDTIGNDGHEYAIGYVSGDEYYGAKASINVWNPQLESPDEFSLSQIWITTGSFEKDLNTIEAGWQVSPELYGDSYPRFFTYWTSDDYQGTGCYNLLCSGFVQTSSKIAIGAAISPTSTYNGGQFDISLMIWKDPKNGNWWLEYGSNGEIIGYWPSSLFTQLKDHATMVQFGGEIVNSMSTGAHTSTQMGSGHFADEGFAKASYFRNMQVVDSDNSLIPLQNLKVLANSPNCYNIQEGTNNGWGNYFYYGGPGRNVNCP
ncbi:unnamed protein product [Trifolium pratense]|uniref:Uncharacterized protein n=1 Tax=Trifolium pratense TaxID=57577 RepID=A0ACB0IUE4_TRIPR|nr:unnamed protein product [Trifolium pratense]